jgi:hypothetical protein
MKLRDNKPKTKALCFAGCSFTWGQNLWYYTALDSLVEDQPYGYDPGLVNLVHHTFRKKWRWPTQVADHFGTVAITHEKNGGNNNQMAEYWKTCFTESTPMTVKAFARDDFEETTPISYSDISHFVFQFTGWMRSTVSIPIDGKDEYVNMYNLGPEEHNRRTREPFLDWLDKNYKSSPNASALGVFHEDLKKRDVALVKNLLQTLENNGVKTFVMTWMPEFCDFIEQDEWLSKRFIKFDYNGNEYRSIEELATGNRDKGIAIMDDTEFFEQPPIDDHLSLKGNKVIADNVIRAIELRQGWDK